MYELLNKDLQRYSGAIPTFQKYFRKYQGSHGFIRFFYKILYKYSAKRSFIEIPRDCSIGAGLYIGHPYGITINPNVIIGINCNIHKGVTIGQENRGIRKGAPIIGNNVWIGINSTIVGKICIGDDVLIAPNTYVNKDIPNHSIVFGNLCIVKHKDFATEGYINRTIK